MKTFGVEIILLINVTINYKEMTSNIDLNLTF